DLADRAVHPGAGQRGDRQRRDHGRSAVLPGRRHHAGAGGGPRSRHLTSSRPGDEVGRGLRFDGPMSATSEPVDTHGDRYGNAFLLSDAPDNQLPSIGMPAVDAMRLLGEELVLDGIPWRNLATFVTTWMEPEAQRVIAENLHRNYIDHAEYPQTAVI